MAERKLINIVNYTGKVYDDVTLSELEPGSLFSIFETGDNGVTELLALKTEYGNNEGGVDAYLLGSGEKLSCNGKTSTKESCDNIFVRPVMIEATGPLLYYDKWNELKERVKADLKYHKSGVMQSMAEAIHGETECENFLKYMEEIESKWEVSYRVYERRI